MHSEINVRRPDAELPVPQRLRLPIDVVTVVLGLSLWMAVGCLVLAIAEGLGEHPMRRLVLGLSLVIMCIVALRWRMAVCSALRTRPWLVLPLAALQLTVIAVDGLIGEPYIAFLLTSIGIAAIVARARTVWMCVALLDVGYLALALLESSPSEHVADGNLGTVLGVLVGNVAAAVPLMLLRQRFSRVMTDALRILEDVREGAPAFTPALARVIAPERSALPSGGPHLTPSERRVVEALATGLTPKQIAYDGRVSVATIRTHIKNAKRKLGARTLAELSAMTARSDWLDLIDDGGSDR